MRLIGNRRINKTPIFQILSDDQRIEIYHAVLEVLHRTGVDIEEAEALSLLKEAGAHIDAGRVRIPPSLVEWSIRNAPKQIIIYTRDGKPALRLQGKNSYFGTGPTAPYIVDLPSQNQRKFAKRDVEIGALLQDALTNIDFVMSMGAISDKPTSTSDLHQFQAMMFNTEKPIVCSSYTLQSVQDIVKMASIVRGSEEALRTRPFLLLFACPSSPLFHTKEAIQKLLFCADRGIPAVYIHGSSGGGTAPATSAGQLITCLAELLTGVVISQIKNKGTPIVVGGVTSVMDMHTTVLSYGAPELSIMCAGLAEMCQFLGLPMLGTAGCSDAKILDEQAAIESTFSCLTQALSGANLIHDVGFLASGSSSSYGMLVMSDEIIGMVKRFMEGISTDEKYLSLDLIDEVGPRGEYLTRRETLNHFRAKHWKPKLMNRNNYETWVKNGSKELKDRTSEKVEKLINSYNPKPLGDEKRGQITKILREREKQG